jgi:hypothetical protein
MLTQNSLTDIRSVFSWTLGRVLVTGVGRDEFPSYTRSPRENPLTNPHSKVEFHYVTVKQSPTDFVSKDDPATLNRPTAK